MKLRLIITFLACLFFSSGAFSQSNVVFYSKAPMYVSFPEGKTTGVTKESTTLHIEGSASFTNMARIDLLGRMQLTGDFINDITTIRSLGGDPRSDGPLLFKKDINTIRNESVVAFVGKNIKQRIRRSDRLVKNINGSVDDEFQKIEYFLNFPTLRVEQLSDKSPFYDLDGNDQAIAPAYDPRKVNYLAVDTSAAMMVDHLVVPKYNRFAVEGGLSTYIPRELNIGQALIKQAYFTNEAGVELEDTNSQTDGTGSRPYYSQVNLNLYNYEPNGVNSDVFAPNHTNIAATKYADRTLVNNEGKNFLLGFSPPFSKLGGDYFFYHMLTQPSQRSFNSDGGNIVDPYKTLEPGRGYFVAMDVTDFDYKDNIDPRWVHDMLNENGTGGDHRARGGFIFNRGIMADFLYPGFSADLNQRGFSRFTYEGSNLPKNDGTDTYENRDKKIVTHEEKFNVEDVVVDLEAGFNFLGNPFMAPIDLSTMIGWFQTYPGNGEYYSTQLPEHPTSDDGHDDEGYARGIDISELFAPDPSEKVYASTKYLNTYERMVRTKVWFVNQATAQYSTADGLTHFEATYDYLSRISGATQPDTRYDNPSGFKSLKAGDIGAMSQGLLVAPMQMFGIQANSAFKFKLDKRLRSFGYTDFRKSSDADKSEEMYKTSMKDVLVVELVNLVDKTSDRTAVVLRKDASTSYEGDFHDTRKGISKAMETYQDVILSDGKNRTYPEASRSIVYTKSTDGESLLGNGLPLNIKEVPLYITPPSSQQTMKLNFYNRDLFTTAENVWLVDRYENKTVKIESGTTYEFTSSPTDLDDKNNRFILRFWGEDEEVVKEESNVTCYYNTSILHVAGLTDADINSTLTIYDMQGRLIGKTRITDAPSMEYVKPLSLGTYIMKIEGARNITNKFVNLSR